MDLATSLPTFVVAIVLISASPGPAIALIVRRAAVRGWRGAVPTAVTGSVLIGLGVRIAATSR